MLGERKISAHRLRSSFISLTAAGGGAPETLAASVRRDGGPIRPVAALFGEWNTSNLGDRAIHREVVRFFTECGWRTESYGLGSLVPVEPGNTAAESPPSHSAVLTRIVRDTGPGLHRVLRGVRQRYRMRALLHRLSRVQAVSIGGGALLSDANLHFPQSLSLVAEAARRLDIPLLCLGCSAEGAWSARGEQKIREALEACALIAVRDDPTAARVGALLRRPVPVFGDFCLTEEHLKRKEGWTRPREAWAINVSRIAEPWSAAQQQYEDVLVSLINEGMRNATKNGLRTVRLFTTGHAQDVTPAQRVFAHVSARSGVELHFPACLDELSDLLRTCALVFASRLHAAILALAAGAPAIAFSPAPKLHNFFSTMGLADFSCDLRTAARLVRWIAGGGYEALLDGQRVRLADSPVWKERVRIRRVLQTVAGDYAACRISPCT